MSKDLWVDIQGGRGMFWYPKPQTTSIIEQEAGSAVGELSAQDWFRSFTADLYVHAQTI